MLKNRKQILISLLLVALTYFVLNHVEYGSYKFELLSNLLLLALIGSGFIALLRNKKYKTHKVKIIIGFSLYLLFTFLFLFSVMMCGNANDSKLYVQKENKTTSIICRSYECFLTSGPCDLYKCNTIAGKLKWVTKYTGTVDTTKWDKVSR